MKELPVNRSLCAIPITFFAALTVCAGQAAAQCATEDEAKASLVALNAEMDDAKAVQKTSMAALLAQVDANGTKLKWDGKRRAEFVSQLIKTPAFLRFQEDKQEHLKQITSVQEELQRVKPENDVKTLCSIVIRYQAPFRAIARIDEEQMESLKAAVAAMK